MRILFHSFQMGDVDDVEVYAAFPIREWQQTEQGQWVMAHARNLRFFHAPDMPTLGQRVDIIGEIDEGPLLTEYLLRWKIIQSW